MNRGAGRVPGEELPLRFRSMPGEARILWHPAAHAAMGAYCSFFLMTASDSLGAAMIKGLQEVLEEIEVDGATTHILYGTDDVLIRVWLTNEKRRAFIRKIQSLEAGLNLETILEFKANTVYYAGQPERSIKDNDLFREKVQEIAIASLEEDQDSDRWSEVVQSGIQDHLLIPYVSPPGVKIYLFIYSPNHSKAPSLDILKEVVELAGLQAPSIYMGIGFCEAIIKGVLGTYAETLGAVQRIQSSLKDYGFYSWTLVPPDYGNQEEGEVLNLPKDSAADLIHRLQDNHRSDDVPSQRAEETLQDDTVRSQVNRLLDIASRELKSPREEERFHSILYSALSADAPTLNKRLSFLISIESNLRDLLEIFLVRENAPLSLLSVDEGDVEESSSMGRYQEVLSSFGEGSEIAGPVYREILRCADMPILFHLLGISAGIGFDRLLAELPIYRWIGLSPRIVELRNSYAHGLLLDNVLDANFTEEFWEMMEMVIYATALQIALEDAIENTG